MILNNWMHWSNVDPRQVLEANHKIIVYTEHHVYIGYVEIKHGYSIIVDNQSSLAITETGNWPSNWWWIKASNDT